MSEQAAVEAESTDESTTVSSDLKSVWAECRKVIETVDVDMSRTGRGSAGALHRVRKSLRGLRKSFQGLVTETLRVEKAAKAERQAAKAAAKAAAPKK